LTDSALSESDYNSHCNNGTGRTGEFTSGNPNETSEAEPSPTQSGAGGQSPSPNAAASHVTVAPWLLGAVGALAFGLL